MLFFVFGSVIIRAFVNEVMNLRLTLNATSFFFN